jgi:hypothetical protein
VLTRFLYKKEAADEHCSLDQPVIFLPMLCPGVREVDDEDQLHQDEEEGAGQPEVHPGVN